MADYAPIAVFIYRRPAHLRRTLESLMQCAGFAASPLIVFGDGPRSDADRADVAATRAVAKELLGERAEYHFQEANQGLSRSVIHGVGEVLARFGRVIVVEDDLQLAPEFLSYMNDALERYADAPSIYQISAYQFSVAEFAQRRSALFLPLTVSWGWATWKRAWDQFDPMALGWDALKTDKALRRRFNLDGAYDYATMLKRQMAGLQDSWAIRWYWSVFRHQGLVLFPPRSLVQNTGFDGSGTHGRGLLRRFSAAPASRPSAAELELPAPSEAVRDADFAAVKRAISRMNGGRLTRCLDSLRNWFRP
ncbi:MAG TPA: glycosyltransferase [Rhodocyclaceae bacterium]